MSEKTVWRIELDRRCRKNMGLEHLPLGLVVYDIEDGAPERQDTGYGEFVQSRDVAVLVKELHKVIEELEDRLEAAVPSAE